MNGCPLLGTTHTEAMRLLESFSDSDSAKVSLSLLVCDGLESDVDAADGVDDVRASREPISHAVDLKLNLEGTGLVLHVSEFYVCASEEEERADGAHLVLQGAVSVANSTLCVCSSASSSLESSSSSALVQADGEGDAEEAMQQVGLVLESERVSHRRCVADLYRQSKAANPNVEPEIVVDFFTCANCNTQCIESFFFVLLHCPRTAQLFICHCLEVSI